MSYQVSFCFWLLTYEQNVAQELNKCVFDACRNNKLSLVIGSTTLFPSWLKLRSRQWKKKWYASSLPLSEYDCFPPLFLFSGSWLVTRTSSPKHPLTISLPCLLLNYYRLWRISRNASGRMKTLAETSSFWRKNLPLIFEILRMSRRGFFFLHDKSYPVCSGHTTNTCQSWRRDTYRGHLSMNRMISGKRTLLNWMRRTMNNSSQFKPTICHLIGLLIYFL